MAIKGLKGKAIAGLSDFGDACMCARFHGHPLPLKRLFSFDVSLYYWTPTFVAEIGIAPRSPRFSRNSFNRRCFVVFSLF